MKRRLPGWLRKIFWVFGTLFGIFLLAAILVPIFVDVDSFRPKITEAVQKKINGSFTLGKLHLSLWGQIRVVVDGFTLKEANGTTVATAKDVDFHLPFWSVITGAPEVRLRMNEPQIFVVKRKDGKLNVLTLMKTDPTAPTATKPEDAGAKPSGSPLDGLPSIAQRARFGMDISKAHVVYRDELTKLDSKIDDLNFELRDASLTAPSKAKFWAVLDTTMGKTLSVKGPLTFAAEITPSPEATTPLSAGKAAVRIDADKLAINAGGSFLKSDSVPANANLSVHWGQGKLVIDQGGGHFHNVVLELSGSVDSMDTEPALAIDGKTNSFGLKDWNQLVPMLKEYELGGSASAEFSLRGTAAAPQYRARLGAKAITAKAPGVAVKPEINGEVLVVTDKVERIDFRVQAPGTDIRLTGNIVNFGAPKVHMKLVGPSLDADKLMGPPGAKKAPGDTKTASSEKPAGDMDAALDPIRKNDMLRNASLGFVLDIKKVIANNAVITDLGGSFQFNNLVAALDGLKMKVFGGAIATSGTVDLKPRAPTYKLHVQVASLDMKKAMESQMALFKDTLLGQMSFSLDATGSSLNPEPAKKNLNAKGSLKIANAAFQNIDINKVVKENISLALDKAAKSIPNFKKPDLRIPEVAGEYEAVTADFTISKGIFNAPNFFAKAKENKGIDVRGNTTLNLIDQGLAADWTIIDTWNLTKAREVSVTIDGTTINNILVDGNAPFQLPVKVRGLASKPVFDYGAGPEALSKVAVNNTKKAAEARLKQEAQKVLEANKPKLKDAFKKLFK